MELLTDGLMFVVAMLTFVRSMAEFIIVSAWSITKFMYPFYLFIGASFGWLALAVVMLDESYRNRDINEA